MPITPFIHITAAYSNAVLVAILPHISDYAKKLDLPIPQPITVSQVAHFGVEHLQGEVGGGVWLTNYYLFSFKNGYVNMFRLNKHNPFNDDNPAENWPKYAFGKINMTTNQALDLIRASITKLGYDVKTFHVDQPPTSMTGPYDLTNEYKRNQVPYCEVEWKREIESPADVTNSYSIQAQVNMESKTLIGLFMSSQKLWQTNPPVAVVPELESDYRKRMQSHMFTNTNAPARLQLNQSLPPSLPGVEPNSSPP